MTSPAGNAVGLRLGLAFTVPNDALLPGATGEEVRRALAVELARLDVPVSSRAEAGQTATTATAEGRTIRGSVR